MKNLIFYCLMFISASSMLSAEAIVTWRVQGNDAIVKVQGRLDSGIIYLMIKDDKLVMSSQGNALQLDNLKGAKFKLEN